MNEEEEAGGTCFLWEGNLIPGTFLCGLQGSVVSLIHVSTGLAIAPEAPEGSDSITPVPNPSTRLSSCRRLCTSGERMSEVPAVRVAEPLLPAVALRGQHGRKDPFSFRVLEGSQYVPPVHFRSCAPGSAEMQVARVLPLGVRAEGKGSAQL